jgi:hypothetical protein
LPKISLGAVIPVQQYGNLQPTVECESETIAEALDEALGHLQAFWNRVGQKPLEIHDSKSDAPVGQILRCRVSGAEVIFDPIAHTYHDKEGNRYLGGSTFAGRYKRPFEAKIIAGKMAEKNGVDPGKILDMWKLNAEASSTFGTSVHAALQLYGEYLELSKAVKNGSDESALTSNPVLRPIVEAFFTDERKQEKAFYEEFVADAKNLRCGLIDRLTVDEDGGLFVEDFKTNADVAKPETILEPFRGVVPSTTLGIYFLQLSYYGTVLAAHGRLIRGLRVHHWTGSEWVTHESPMIDLTPAFNDA